MAEFKMDEVIVLNVKGEYAHFKKIFTTTSPLTYGIPPRTAVMGLIGAILGYERDKYYEIFNEDNFKIGLKLLNPVKKTRINLNLLKTKDRTENLIHYNKNYPEKIERIQVPLEAVKKPDYRIYLWLKEKNIRKKLEKKLRRHKSVYTPYLGLSEFIAQFEYIGTKQSAKKTSSEKKISTVIPGRYIPNIQIEEKLRYERERIPGHMKINSEGDRVPSDFIDVVYEKKGFPLTIKDVTYHQVGKEDVLFL
ncbi:MAG: type I-B CRISPR-associated protein Cas5b [Candidatus Thermoplasmatota archaeon]